MWVKCTEWKMDYFILFLESKDKEKKEQEKYVAQQRVYLTKKEGFLKSFAKQTDTFHDLASWKTQDLETELRIFES